MEVINRAVRAIKRVSGVADVERRDGVYVSRPVTNGQEWHDWAVKHGIPSPLAADDFHVTILHSVVDVKMIPDKTAKAIYIGPGYGDAACFAKLGPTAEALCVCFSDWDLYNRHWNFLSNGGVSKWPTYRPHMTISMNAADFELTDEALADAPLWINLGPEVYADLKQPAVTEAVERDPEGVEEGVDTPELLQPSAEARASAAEIMRTADLSPIDRIAVMDIASGHPISRATAVRIGGQNWASAELKDMITKPKEKPKEKEAARGTREVTITIGNLPADLQRDLPAFCANDEERTVFGIANITTVGGDLVVDAHNTSFTTNALTTWLERALLDQVGCDFSHQGEATMRIAQGIVLLEYMQHALGIDLGFEPTLVLVRVPRDEDWAEVKRGEWMFSIAGTFAYEEVEVE